MVTSKSEVEKLSLEELERKQREFEYRRDRELWEVDKNALKQEVVRRNMEVCLSALKLIACSNQDSERKLKEKVINKISELVDKLEAI